MQLLRTEIISHWPSNEMAVTALFNKTNVVGRTNAQATHDNLITLYYSMVSQTSTVAHSVQWYMDRHRDRYLYTPPIKRCKERKIGGEECLSPTASLWYMLWAAAICISKPTTCLRFFCCFKKVSVSYVIQYVLDTAAPWPGWQNSACISVLH